MRNIEIGKKGIRPILLPLVVFALFIYFVGSSLGLNSASYKLKKEYKRDYWFPPWLSCAPFPDEDINRYVGKVVESSVLSEIGRLIDERYPGHSVTFMFKIIDDEAEWIREDNMWNVHFQKVFLIAVWDHGLG